MDKHWERQSDRNRFVAKRVETVDTSEGMSDWTAIGVVLAFAIPLVWGLVHLFGGG